MYIFYTFLEKQSGKTKREVEFNAGRFLVEYGAKNFFHIENSEIEVIGNKPKFKYSTLQFSISHSKDIAAVCFSDKPVGFDIEYIEERDYKAIARRMGFKLREDNIEEFYRCWTRYEAEYKLGKQAKTIISEKFLDKYIMTIAGDMENTQEVTKVRR